MAHHSSRQGLPFKEDIVSLKEGYVLLLRVIVSSEVNESSM